MENLGGGIIDTRALTGAERSRIYRKRQAGLLVELAPGRFMNKRHYASLNPHQRELARTVSLASTQPSAAVAGRSAALVLDLPLPYAFRPKVELAFGRRRGGTSPLIHYRTLGKHAGHEIVDTQFGQARVTDIATTCIDLARWYSLEAGVTAMDAALADQRCSLIDIADKAVDATGSTAAHNARTAAVIATNRSESPMESTIKTGLYVRGFRNVWQQVAIFGPREGFIARVDFYLPDCGVVVEYDGAGKYKEDPEKAQREYEQTVSLQALGLVVVRIRVEHLRDELVWEAIADHTRRGPVRCQTEGGVRAF